MSRIARPRGFTLVEAILVVAIISLLAGLVFVVQVPARARAREIRCISNLHQIGVALAMYQSDYEGVQPDVGSHATWSDCGLPGDLMLPAFVRSYIHDPRVLKCEAFQDDAAAAKAITTYAWVPRRDDMMPGRYRFENVVAARGEAIPIVIDYAHNPRITGEEPRWATLRVLFLRLNMHVENRNVPMYSTFEIW